MRVISAQEQVISTISVEAITKTERRWFLCSTVRIVGPRLCMRRVVFCVRVAVIRRVNATTVAERSKKMAYTPELSYGASCTLRRLSWSLNKPMTKTLEWIFTELVKFIPAAAICEACKDKSKCGDCSFGGKES